MADESPWKYLPQWALDMEKTQAAATDWGAKQRSNLGQRWGDLMRQDFQSNLAQIGYAPDGQYVGQASEPVGGQADAGARYRGPAGATPQDVAAIGGAPQGIPPSLNPGAPPPTGEQMAQTGAAMGAIAQLPQQELFTGLTGGDPSQPLTNPALHPNPNGPLPGPGDPNYQPVTGAAVLGAAGVPEGPARDIGGRVADYTLDPVNLLPVGLARRAGTAAQIGRVGAEALGAGVLGGVGSYVGEQADKALGGSGAIGNVAGGLLGGGVGGAVGAGAAERGGPALARATEEMPARPGMALASNREAAGAVGGALYNLQDQPPQQEGESGADYWKRLGVTTAERAAGAAGLAAFTRPGVRRMLGSVAQDTLHLIPQGPLTPQQVAEGEAALQRIAASQELPKALPPTGATVYDQLGLSDTLQRKFVRAVTDRSTDWSQLENAFRQHVGRPLTDNEKITLQAYRNPALAAKVEVDDNFRPIVQAVADPTSERAVNDYLTALHNLDVARTFEAREPGTGLARKFSGDVNAEQSGLALRVLEQRVGPQEWQKVQGVADRLVRFNDAQLQQNVDAGLVSATAAQQWRQDYPHYARVEIPAYLQNWKEDAGAGRGASKTLNVPSNEEHALSVKGTVAGRESPLVASYRDALEGEELRQRNRAFLAFHDMREQFPLLQQAYPAVNTAVPGALDAARRSGKVFSGYVDGEKRYFLAPSKEAANAISLEGTAKLPPPWNYLAMGIQMFKDAVTTASPEFAIAGNLINDVPDALFRGMVREGGPENAPKVLANLLVSYVDAFKGIMSGQFKGKYSKEYLGLGGGMSGWFDRKPVAVEQGYQALKRQNVVEVHSAKDLVRLLMPSTKGQTVAAVAGGVGGAAITPREPGQSDADYAAAVLANAAKGAAGATALVKSRPAVRAVGERIELGTRTGLFRLATGDPLKVGPVNLGGGGMTRQGGIRDGMAVPTTRPEAMRMGRTGTIDFAMGGQWAKGASQLIPFFNPAIQALAAIPRAARENPKGMVKTLAAIIPAYLMVDAWNHQNPQMSAVADDTNASILSRGLVIVIPGSTTNARGEPEYHRVLLPMRQLAVPLALVRGITDRALGRDTQTLGALAGQTLSQVSPVSDSSQLIAPGLSTGLQLQQDKDFYRNRNVATARNDQAASPLSRAVAGGVNAVAARANAYPDVRPSQVEFGLRDALGSYGANAADLSEMIAGTKAQGSTSPQDLPLVGGAVRRLVRREGGETLQRAREQALPDALRSALYQYGLKPDVAPVPSYVTDSAAGIRRAPLTQQEEAAYQNLANGLVAQGITGLFRDTDFHRAPPAARQALVQQAVAAAHQLAEERVVRAIGARTLQARATAQAVRASAAGVR